MKIRHILESQQFSRELLDQLFERARTIERSLSSGQRESLMLLKHFKMFSVFYEPSTRTRMSFAAAARFLGIDVQGTENARDFSSAVKGETLEDTIRVLCGYLPDLIVLRHSEVGAAVRAAAVSSVPIINAGDGAGQHPTQALLDLYTILNEADHLSELKVVMGGDLKFGRTVRSLAYLLTRYENVHITFVAPTELKIERDICHYLDRKGTSWDETTNVRQAVADADVVYWTRLQTERLDKAVRKQMASENVMARYRITPLVMSWMKPSAIVMHPLPRIDEIEKEVDADPRAKYFKQAENGLYVRMALMEYVLG